MKASKIDIAEPMHTDMGMILLMLEKSQILLEEL